MKKTMMMIIVASGFIPSVVYADDAGLELFNDKCSGCHAIAGQRMGPSIKAMSKDPGFLNSAIADGVTEKGPFPMPAFAERLKPEQIDTLVTYIRSQQ